MKFPRTDIVKLLNRIARETKYDLAHTNFPSIKEKLDEKFAQLEPSKTPLTYSDEYLYRKLYLPSLKQEKEFVSANVAIINAIAQSIGFDSFSHFVSAVDSTDSPVLRNCMGQWYSYVRCNSGQPYVLRSPVQIHEHRKEIVMELQGPQRKFRGQIKLVGECLHCLLESAQIKKIYLILKIGFSSNPDVLQGIFSGLSTGGDPIAGREVLVRSKLGYGQMSPARIAISELQAARSEEEKRIGNYFSGKENSILKAGTGSTYGLDDLITSPKHTSNMY
jgi:hypothetical protein